MEMTERHPNVRHAMRWLEPNTNLPAHLFGIALKFQAMAEDMLDLIQEDSPELTMGLRKLLEAKDCFVRAKIDEVEYAEGSSE